MLLKLALYSVQCIEKLTCEQETNHTHTTLHVLLPVATDEIITI